MYCLSFRFIWFYWHVFVVGRFDIIVQTCFGDLKIIKSINKFTTRTHSCDKCLKLWKKLKDRIKMNKNKQQSYSMTSVNSLSMVLRYVLYIVDSIGFSGNHFSISNWFNRCSIWSICKDKVHLCVSSMALCSFVPISIRILYLPLLFVAFSLFFSLSFC